MVCGKYRYFFRNDKDFRNFVAMIDSREKRIETFVRLGVQLASFGQDAVSGWVVAEACRENAWFTPSDVFRAVEAIRSEMLGEENLRRWMNSYPLLPVTRPRNVGLIAAGNIPLVGFFDLLCVLLSGHRCLLKPSSKDRVLMEYVVAQLRQFEPGIPVYPYTGTEPLDAVIATGSDNTNRYFRSRYKGIPALFRGSRASVAVLSGEESDATLDLLAEDIFPYSGLGCRNVSRLLVPGEYDLAALLGRLSEFPVPNPRYRNNYLQRRALLAMQGEPFLDGGFFLMRECDQWPSSVSEITVSRYERVEQIAEWLSSREERIQCVVSALSVHSRAVPFGRAQRPSLTDYPDGADVPAFLSEI